MSMIGIARSLSISAAVSTILVLAPAVVVAAVAPEARPELKIERLPSGLTRVAVSMTLPDGSKVMQTLRETPATVRQGPVGLDPRKTAAFVTWDEGDGLRWFSLSQDGGRNWWQGRSTEMEMMLRDGHPAPGDPMPIAQQGLSQPANGRVALLQLKTVSIEAWRQALQSAGAEILGFLPYNTYIVRFDPAALPRLRALEFVERVEPYQPWYRLSSELRRWLESPGDEQQTLRTRVMAFEWGDAGKQRIAQSALALGATVAEWVPNGQIIELNLTRAQMRALAGHDDLLWMDPWTPKEVDMDLHRIDAGTNYIEDNFGFCGQGVRGEVLDAGTEDTHQDFDGILLHGPHNVDSHGTSTYGIVFGNGARDGDGSAQATGHLPCAQGIFADYDSLTDRFAETQELKHSPYFASFQSNSWGDARNRTYDSISQQMDDIIWRLDFAIVQSQSNAGNQDSRPQAWAKNIISVGAVNHYNTLDRSDDCWCSGASIGPAEDGRIKPDVAYWYDEIFTTTSGNTYTSGFGGTSGATPNVAGVLGLMVQMWGNNVWGNNPVGNTIFEKEPHASTIKALLINYSKQYPFSGTSHDLTRVHQGWGIPNLQLAHDRAPRSFVINEDVALKVNDQASYDIAVSSGEPELKVTLAYTDLPGTVSASQHRINDLDLTVTSPGGTVYRGNFGLDANNYSLANGTRDSKNNIENVFVQNPQAGTWKVEIKAQEINQDENLATPEFDQLFALVVSGGTGSICTPPNASFTVSPNPARVGQPVTFDSTVTGGAGGPYSYAWDFNNDGITDSTLADPVFSYNRPYNDKSKLTSRDSANCPGRAENVVTINGPDLRFNDTINLTQVQGNNNGAVDPGEIWDITVRLKNQGNENAIGVSAGLRIASGNAGALSLITADGTYPDIAVNAVQGGTAFRFQVGQGFPCGNDAVFDVIKITTTNPGNVYPEELGKVHVLVGGAGPSQNFYSDGFETNTGWTLVGGEWEMRNPLGLGGGSSAPGQPKPKPDPTSAAEGTKVLGNDLSGTAPTPGNYESNQHASATSPAINCSDAVAVQLQYSRWLNVAPPTPPRVGDVATLEVTRDGSTWVPLYSQAAGSYEDHWTVSSYDVSAYADRNPSFRVRFRLDSDEVLNYSGWNIDDIRLYGVTRNSCEPVARAKPGKTKNLTVQKSAGSLQLGWAADCGGTGSYGVYRGNLHAGYGSIQAEAGRCNVAGLSTTVPSGANDADFFLIVPSDGGFEGSYGTLSSGAERAPAVSACHPRDQVSSCTP